jgi:hypothetical protein
MLSDAQIDRYSRQIVMREIGGRGQDRLLRSHLLLLSGPGELEPGLAYLVGAGVGMVSIPPVLPAPHQRRIAARMRDLNPDARLVWSEPAAFAEHEKRRTADAALILNARQSSSPSMAKAQTDEGSRHASYVLARALAQPNPRAGKATTNIARSAREHRRIEEHADENERVSTAYSRQRGNDVGPDVRSQYLKVAPIPAVAAYLGRPLELAVIPSRRPCLECIRARCLRAAGPRAADWEVVVMMAVTEVLKLLLGLAPPAPSLLRFHGLVAEPVPIPTETAHCRICAR